MSDSLKSDLVQIPKKKREKQTVHWKKLKSLFYNVITMRYMHRL